MQIRGKKLTKRDLFLFGFGLSLIFLFWALFMWGAVTSCDNADGTLININNPFKVACVDGDSFVEYVLENYFYRGKWRVTPSINLSGVLNES